MKVCLINNLFYPNIRGGAERIITQQVRELQEQGNEVFVITTQKTREHPPAPRVYLLASRDKRRAGRKHKNTIDYIENVKIYRLRPQNLFSFYEYNNKPLWLRLIWLAIDLVNFGTAGQVKKILKQEKPDLVWTHNLRGLSYLLPRIIKKLRIKHYHTLHDIQLAYPSGLLIKGKENKFYNTFFLRRWYEVFCRWVFNSPDKIFSPSRWLIDFYIKRSFFSKSEKELRKPEFRIQNLEFRIKNKEKIKILYVGQLEYHKGILFLIKAFNNFSRFQIPDSRLNIIGSGSKLAEAKQLAKDNPNIIFHGSLSHNQVMRHYQQADLTIVSSLTYENAPTVIYESLSAGTPVLTSNIGGIPEIIKENKNGWLFRAGDEHSFISRLRSILNQP